MAEDQNSQQASGNPEPHGAGGEPHGSTEPETVTREEYEKLLAESRKWEKRAKDNASAAKELEDLRAKGMTDAERADAAVKRAEEAEARIAEYERRAERDGLVSEIASGKSVDVELLSRMAGDTREEIEANAEWLEWKLSERSIYPSVADKGQQKAPEITEKDIEAIKNPRERVAARAQMIARNKR